MSKWTAVFNRVKEPSTWAAIAAMLAVLGVNLPMDWAIGMTGGVAALAGVAAAVLAVVMPEKGERK